MEGYYGNPTLVIPPPKHLSNGLKRSCGKDAGVRLPTVDGSWQRCRWRGTQFSFGGWATGRLITLQLSVWTTQIRLFVLFCSVLMGGKVTGAGGADTEGRGAKCDQDCMRSNSRRINKTMIETGGGTFLEKFNEGGRPTLKVAIVIPSAWL